MSRIEELIKDQCPNGVEFKRLGEICKIETGKLNANKAKENGQYVFFTTSKEISHIDSYRWDTEALLVAGNANVGDVKYYNGKFEAYQRTYVLTDFDKNIKAKYLYYCLKNNLKAYLDLHKKEAAMTYIVLNTLTDFKIPVPPMSVQKEIVRILDTFTELTDQLKIELALELDARKKQYEFYRDKMLNVRTATRYMKLIEVADYIRGVTYSRSDETKNDDSIKVLRANNITLETSSLNFDDVKAISKKVHIDDKKWLKKDDILICAGSGSKEHIGKNSFYRK